MSDAVLILDCPDCADPARADQDGRQCDGLREWTAEFDVVEGTNHYVPVDLQATYCPECGAAGRAWRY